MTVMAISSAAAAIPEQSAGQAARPDDDPSPRIQAAFTQIGATRMQGLPYLNPRLSVAAVGFRLWQESWIGALVTPWGINLLQWPTPQAPFPPWRADQVFEVPLPGATLSFMPAQLDALGDYRLCPLFSPAQQFANQEAACATAHEVLRLLFTPEMKPDAADAIVAQSAIPAMSALPTSAQPAGAPSPSRRRLFGLR
jgi:[NiFe] hydrogenase assembly HybE family chaperone